MGGWGARPECRGEKQRTLDVDLVRIRRRLTLLQLDRRGRSKSNERSDDRQETHVAQYNFSKGSIVSKYWSPPSYPDNHCLLYLSSLPTSALSSTRCSKNS